MRAVIFLGAPDVCESYLDGFIKKDDYIICADSGYKYAKSLGLKPDAVLGDFDSFSLDNVREENPIIYPVEKDFTDCEIAILFALEKGAGEIVLVCAKGGRSDHFLANIHALMLAEKKGVSAFIYSENERIYFKENFFETEGDVGDVLSVIPFGDVKNFTTHNLKYALKNADLPYSGVSNVFLEKNASLSFEGRAIIVVCKE